MYKFIEKFQLDKYVSSYLILALDLVVSVGVTLFALFWADVIFVDFSYREFVLPLILASCVTSAISFMLLGVHKIIIRHSTLRELWKISVAVLCKGALMAGVLFTELQSQT